MTPSRTDLESTPPEGLVFDEIEDTAVLETYDPTKLTPEQRARVKAYRRRQRRDREAVQAVIRAVKRFGWKVIVALSLPIAIEVIRIVLDWMAHR